MDTACNVWDWLWNRFGILSAQRKQTRGRYYSQSSRWCFRHWIYDIARCTVTIGNSAISSIGDSYWSEFARMLFCSFCVFLLFHYGRKGKVRKHGFAIRWSLAKACFNMLLYTAVYLVYHLVMIDNWCSLLRRVTALARIVYCSLSPSGVKWIRNKQYRR